VLRALKNKEMPLKLAAARIFVWDLKEARAFYEQKLGMRVGAAGPEDDFVVFEAQTCYLVIERVASDAPPEDRALVGRFTGLSFNVKNIEQCCKQLMEQGVHFTGHPERQAWGGTLATFRDPAGNELQLVEYPGVA
jgi:catechol 2,3-dioxygenase-like lactoylglutathione lyase family enzyme